MTTYHFTIFILKHLPPSILNFPTVETSVISGTPEENNLTDIAFTKMSFKYEHGNVFIYLDKQITMTIAYVEADAAAQKFALGKRLQ